MSASPSIKLRTASVFAKFLCSNARMRARILDELLANHLLECTTKLLRNPPEEAIEIMARDHGPQALTALTKQPSGVSLREIFLTGCQGREKPLSEDELNSFQAASGAALHYSQEGEDILLQRGLQGREPGFYVDVGAHHPMRFSNTYALYRQGWRGINIDATPGSMELFTRLRPEDVNLECAISDRCAPLDFHIFREPALNTFDAPLAESYVAAGWERLEIRAIPSRPLRDVFKEHWPKGRPVHVMSIDVEGDELGVLHTNDWDVCHPEWIIIEALDTGLDSLANHPAISYLAGRGYKPTSKLVQSVILKRDT